MSSPDPNDRKQYLPSSSMEQNQLGMSADPHAGLRAMQPMPGYTPRQPDPYAGFTFQPQSQTQPQAHHPHMHHHPPPHSQSHPPPHPQGPAHPQQPPPPPHPHHASPQNPLQSPSMSRKRRASEENITGLPQLYSPPSAVSAESRYGVPPAPGTAEVETIAPSSTTRKKSRTNTPWTAAEEQRLKTMRDAGQSWSEIAKTFPSRTEGSVKKHYYKDMHYAEFAEDESAALLAAIKEYETSKWKVIGQKVGKPAKACEQYAKEHFSGIKS